MDLLLEEVYTQELEEDVQKAVWLMIDEPEDIAIALLNKTVEAYKNGSIKQDIQWNARYKGSTLLHRVVQKHYLMLVKRLIELGADPAVADEWGNTVFAYSLNMARDGEIVEKHKHFLESLYLILFKPQIFQLQYFFKSTAIDSFKDLNGNTPLMCFMSMIADLHIDQFLKMVNLFIECGSDVHTRNNQGDTLLHTLAAMTTYKNDQLYRVSQKKLIEATNFLMNKKLVDAKKANRYGVFAWEIASVLRYIELETKLFEQSGRLKDHSYVYQFIYWVSKPEHARFTFKSNQEIKRIFFYFKYQCIQNPRDILHLLVKYGIATKVVDAYLSGWHASISKNINAKWSTHPEGYAPLHVAACEGNFDIIDTLLNYGAKIDVLDNNQKTILHHVTQCRFLAREPIDKRHKEYYIKGYVECVENLIQRNITINLQDYKGNTALHYLITDGFVYLPLSCVIRATKFFLYRKNINVNVRNNIGETVTHHVTRCGRWGAKIMNQSYIELIEHLILKGANFNLQDKNGNTALHYLVTDGFYALHHAESLYSDINNTTVVHATKLLLDCEHIDVNIQNKEGQTPHTKLSDFNVANQKFLRPIKENLLAQLAKRADAQDEAKSIKQQSRRFWGRW